MKVPDSRLLKAIHERRSVRQFMDAPVVRDLIMTALEAAS
jgi:nitroreductase